jgi:hypothetical protein
MRSFETFKYKSLSKSDKLMFSFPVCNTFILFSCLIDLAKNSSSILNNNEETEHPCLVPNFRENVVFLLLVRC